MPLAARLSILAHYHLADQLASRATISLQCLPSQHSKIIDQRMPILIISRVGGTIHIASVCSKRLYWLKSTCLKKLQRRNLILENFPKCVSLARIDNFLLYIASSTLLLNLQLKIVTDPVFFVPELIVRKNCVIWLSMTAVRRMWSLLNLLRSWDWRWSASQSCTSFYECERLWAACG